MKPDELVAHCRKQIELAGPDATVLLTMPGRMGHTARPRRKRLWQPDGPFGELSADVLSGVTSPHVMVMFKAKEVIEAVRKQLLAEAEWEDTL